MSHAFRVVSLVLVALVLLWREAHSADAQHAADARAAYEGRGAALVPATQLTRRGSLRPRRPRAAHGTIEPARLQRWCDAAFTSRDLLGAWPRGAAWAPAVRGRDGERHLLGWCRAEQSALEERARQERLDSMVQYSGYGTDDALAGSSAQRLPRECDAVAALLPARAAHRVPGNSARQHRNSLRTSYRHALAASCCAACACTVWCGAWVFEPVSTKRSDVQEQQPDNCWLFPAAKSVSHLPSYAGVSVGEARATPRAVAVEPSWSTGMFADAWEGGRGRGRRRPRSGGEMHRRRRAGHTQQRTRSGLADEVARARQRADQEVASALERSKAAAHRAQRMQGAWSGSGVLDALRSAVGTASAWGEGGGGSSPGGPGNDDAAVPPERSGWLDCVRPRCSRAPHCTALWAQAPPRRGAGAVRRQNLACAGRADCDACSSESAAGGAWSPAAGVPADDLPCCTAVMFEMLRDLSSFLSSKRLPSVLAFGTLLGAARSGSVIPWTADIDIAMPRWAREALIKDTAWTAEFAALGYSAFLSGIGRVCVNARHPRFGAHPRPPAPPSWAALPAVPEDTPDPQWAYIKDHVYVDIYTTDADGTTSITLEEPQHFTSEPANVFPLQNCTLLGETFSCPHRPEILLREEYGQHWRRPTDNNPTDQHDNPTDPTPTDNNIRSLN